MSSLPEYPPRSPAWRRVFALCLLVLAPGCDTPPMQAESSPGAGQSVTAPVPQAVAARPSPEPLAALPAEPAPADAGKEIGFYRSGSGIYTRAAGSSGEAASSAGEFTLNFENTSVDEVAKVILGDLLQKNFVVDPRVEGGVTLHTSRALPKDALLPTLELLLRMNGAALVHEDGLYSIVPLEGAVRGRTTVQLGNSNAPIPQGFGIQIVPLRFIAVAEMQKILEPLSEPSNVIRADTNRNLLVLAGSRRELQRLLETIRIFDVDWLAGMSVGLFTPRFVEAKILAGELDKVFADLAGGPLAGLVRIVPIERLNALLAITPRPEYLKKVAEWIGRLDRDVGEAGRNLYVYHVQNGKAVDLAEVLSRVFAEEVAKKPLPPPELAPGLEPVEIKSTMAKNKRAELGRDASRSRYSQAKKKTVARESTAANEGLAINENGTVRVIADEVNNALLIMATAQEYRQVLAALDKLDIVPLQVLIEATIAEIMLTDELRYGLEWFFKNKVDTNRTGRATLDLGDAGLAGLTPGFSYAIVKAADDIRVVLNALAADSKINIVSSPSLMVLNNQTASIQVGDEIPIVTQSQQATDANANVVNTIEYRDTGVLLTVTPRVNAGGLVTMEILQEVSELGTEDFAGDNPTILQRKIESSVAIQSGETVVLGGLIREKRTETESGVPILYNIPVIGSLFGRTDNDSGRTELVVLITPRAVQGTRQAQQVTKEFQRKMESLKPLRAPSYRSGESAPQDLHRE